MTWRSPGTGLHPKDPNALVAADHALISREAEYFSLQGVEQAKTLTRFDMPVWAADGVLAG
jgi:cellulose biosynthesis protein BcsQ